MHKCERAINRERENAVEREKIRRERDPEIIPIRHDVSAIAADLEFADPTAHEQDPKRMRQFVPEDVNQERPRQPEKRDQPQDDAQREKPKFLSRPELLRDRGARENGKKRLRQHRANRQKKKRDDEFHQPRRDQERAVIRSRTPRRDDIRRHRDPTPLRLTRRRRRRRATSARPVIGGRHAALRPAHVIAGSGIDLDHLAFVDEQAAR